MFVVPFSLCGCERVSLSRTTHANGLRICRKRASKQSRQRCQKAWQHWDLLFVWRRVRNPLTVWCAPKVGWESRDVVMAAGEEVVTVSCCDWCLLRAKTERCQESHARSPLRSLHRFSLRNPFRRLWRPKFGGKGQYRLIIIEHDSTLCYSAYIARNISFWCDFACKSYKVFCHQKVLRKSLHSWTSVSCSLFCTGTTMQPFPLYKHYNTDHFLSLN